MLRFFSGKVICLLQGDCDDYLSIFRIFVVIFKKEFMPHSRKRHHRHKQQPPTHLPHARKKSSAVPVLIIFLSFLGIAIAFFAAGANIGWLIAGAVIGAAIGYFFGRRIDRSATKK
jgi:membrane associated rhomboid family serine protease